MKTRAELLICIFMLAAIGVLGPQVERASAAGATITVTTASDDTNLDNHCSIREALQAADTNDNVDTCNAGSPTGSDTIAFAAAINGQAIHLASSLDVDSAVIIKGNGRSKTVFDTNDFNTTSGPSTFEHLSLVDVNNEDGTTTLLDVKATNDINNNSVGSETSIMTIRNSTVPNVTNNSDSGSTSKLRVVRSKIGAIDNNSNNGSITTASITNTTASIFTPAGDGVSVAGSGTTVTITRSTVIGFDIGVDTDGKTKITNSTIIGNISENIDVHGGTTTVLNSTLSKSDRGIVRSAGTIKLTNSIVALTSVRSCTGTVASGGGNISDDGSCHFTKSHDHNNKDPKLGSLANHGGPTQTQLLLKGSPAIDGGLNGPCPATDQRGKKRPQDGDANGTKVCDIGAVEMAKP